MKIPNFESRYQSGTVYSPRDCQSGRYGPPRIVRSTRSRISLRGASNLLLASCHRESVDCGDIEAVGAFCVWEHTGPTAKFESIAATKYTLNPDIGTRSSPKIVTY